MVDTLCLPQRHSARAQTDFLYIHYFKANLHKSCQNDACSHMLMPNYADYVHVTYVYSLNINLNIFMSSSMDMPGLFPPSQSASTCWLMTQFASLLNSLKHQFVVIFFELNYSICRSALSRDGIITATFFPFNKPDFVDFSALFSSAQYRSLKRFSVIPFF